MSNLANSGAILSDAADASSVAGIAPVVLVESSPGVFEYSGVGPADAELIDVTGTGVYEFTTLPPGAAGPRAQAFRNTNGDIVIT